MPIVTRSMKKNNIMVGEPEKKEPRSSNNTIFTNYFDHPISNAGITITISDNSENNEINENNETNENNKNTNSAIKTFKDILENLFRINRVSEDKDGALLSILLIYQTINHYFKTVLVDNKTYLFIAKLYNKSIEFRNVINLTQMPEVEDRELVNKLLNEILKNIKLSEEVLKINANPCNKEE